MAAVASAKFESQHVVSECPCAMMVLPVDIVADCSPQADVAGSWCHWQEPALRNAQALNLIERGPGLGYQPAALVIERDYAVQVARRKQRIAVVEAHVSE